MNPDELIRQQAKSREQRFLNLMQQEFNYPFKIAQAILAEVQDCLFGQPGNLKPGQMCVILLARDARHGRSLSQAATQEVVWTIDAGPEDQEVQTKHGPTALRHVRIQRLLGEAIEQEAVATQEDVAHALHVSVRTIKRDCLKMQEQGIYLPTRGNLRGIGRGQTHKAHIVRRWLSGATYDQVAYHTHHSPMCVRRYIQTFVRVVQLHGKAFTEGEIALALQIGIPLVKEYLSLYQQNDSSFCRQRLADQIERLEGASSIKKGAS